MEEDFVKNLETHQQKVRACQERKGVGSCLKCSLVLECKERQTYVQSVYMSMSKGQQGSFDF
ncbi:hypothetical protein ACFOPX_04425 [Helicobacter baculiformis]|uniref:Uncharacterized protein n=1 Tax=Helicobacter baculiformis TaxID=427351 RepID=A0ABV7ZHL6_9HELI|nr:hypothetical protein [Helicobacter baculiformis]